VRQVEDLEGKAAGHHAFSAAEGGRPLHPRIPGRERGSREERLDGLTSSHVHHLGIRREPAATIGRRSDRDADGREGEMRVSKGARPLPAAEQSAGPRILASSPRCRPSITSRRPPPQQHAHVAQYVSVTPPGLARR